MTGGEISPYLFRRLDFEKHPSGLARLENFLPLPYGGIRKRPGTEYLDTLPAEARLEAFVYDEANRYVVAFTTTNVYVYSPDGTLKSTIAAAFSDPFILQFAHINDVLFIVDPQNPPRQLNRLGDTNWTLEDVDFEFPPLLDQNLDEAVTITVDTDPASPAWTNSTAYAVDDTVTNSNGVYYKCHTAHTSATATEPGIGDDWSDVWALLVLAPGEAVELTASSALFEAGHVGGVWRIEQDRQEDDFESTVTLTNNPKYSNPIPISGRLQFLTTGTWGGYLVIQRSKDGKTWEDWRRWFGSKDRNVDEEFEWQEFYFARIFWDFQETVVTPNGRATIYAIDDELDGFVEITAVNSTTSADGVAKNLLFPGTTYKWTPAAFDGVNGYPQAITLHERRLCFAGTAGNPISLWLSKTDDLLDFETGTEATDSIFVTLATTAQDPIRWMASQRRLMLGTSTSEWVAGSETTDAALSPENFNARQYTHFGSAALPAFRHHDGVFFVQRQGRRFREIGYDITRETYDAADLTRLAEHITKSGIKELDFQAGREPFVWCVLADGTLLSFFYIRAEQISAWSKHTTTGGSFRSVAVIRNDTDDDDVFVTIERGGAFFLEKLSSDQQTAQENGDASLVRFLDCATVDTTGGDGKLVGLDRFDGMEITVMADGIPQTLTVTAGEVDTGRPNVPAIAGIDVTSTLTTLPIDVATQNGTTLARHKRLSRIRADFYNSRGGEFSYDGDSEDVDFDRTSDLGDATPDLVTGWIETTMKASNRHDLQFSFSHSRPWPVTIRAMQLEIEATE